MWVGKGQVLPHHVVPEVDVGGVGKDSGIGLNLDPQHGRVGAVVAQIQGSAVNRVEFDAVAGGDVGGPKGSVVVAVAPHARNQAVLLVRPKVALLLVKPVLFDGALLGGVQVDSEVADRVVAGHFAPVNQGRVELHAFRGGFLIVALRKGGESVGPAVARIRAEVAQVRNQGVVAPRSRRIAHEEVNHSAPLRRPTGLKLLDKRGGVNEVAPVKVVVVEVYVLAVARGVAQKGRPRGVVVEEKGDFAGLVAQPVLEAGFDGGKELVERHAVFGQLGDARGLNQAVHFLALVVAVGPCGELVVGQHAHFGLQLGGIESGAVVVEVRKRRQDAVKGVLHAEVVGFDALHASAHCGVHQRAECRRTGRQVGPVVGQEAQQHQAVAALIDVDFDRKVGGDH